MLADGVPIREDAQVDFEKEGLLDGLKGEEREARRRLLEELLRRGAELAELKEAVAEDRLVLLPVERVVGGTYTAHDIEEKTGVDADVLVRIRRMLGLPQAEADERLFGEEDIEAAKSIKVFLDSGFREDAVAQITRVLGEAMSRLAVTVTGVFADTFLKPGDNEDEVALRFASLAEELTPSLTPILVAAFRAHLHETVSRGMLGQAERKAGQVSDEQEIGVCFADLVGFTRLGGELDVQEIGTMARQLADLANEVTKPPVRLVKTIGDAAMFVSREIGPLVDVALALVEATEDAGMPALRAGIACGAGIQRAGDFYGPSVNLASRVTGLARPGSVLCTREVREAAADEFSWSAAGRHRVKGLDKPVSLHRARRLGSGDEGTDGADAESDGDAEARTRTEDRR